MTVLTYLGIPPNSHSAQMYGPGLKMTKRSSSCAIWRNLGRSKKCEKSRPPFPKSNSPRSGSCRFPATHLKNRNLSRKSINYIFLPKAMMKYVLTQ